MELETLVFIATGVSILSPIVGWGILVNREGKNRGKIDAQVAGSIETMGKDISAIKTTLGNGFITGLKGEVHSMQVNCAREMSGLKTEVTNLKEITLSHTHTLSSSTGTASMKGGHDG